MLNQLYIRNVQSHRRTLFKFSPGLNVIAGDSDLGKSAAVRALQLLIDNKSVSSNDLCSWWADHFLIRGLFNDEYYVERSRSKTENAYRTYTDETKQDPDVFKAFGRSPPSEISDIIKLGPLNVQTQQDSIFLLTKTAGEIARYLNGIVDLNIIDQSLSRAKSTRTKAQDLVESGKQALKRFETTYKELSWLDQAEERVYDVIDIEHQLITHDESLKHLSDILYELKQAEDNKQTVDKSIQYEDEAGALNDRGDKLSEQGIELQEFNKLLDSVSTVENEYSTVQKSLVFTNIIQQAHDRLKTLLVEDTLVKELEGLLTTIDSQREELKRVDEQLTDLEHKRHKLMGERCPLCGTEIKNAGRRKNRS